MELLKIELEPDFGDAAFDFENESCKCVSFALHRFEVVFIHPKYLAEVDDTRLSLKEIRAVIELGVVFLHVGCIELVVDLAYDFLDDVFHSDKARGAAVFVDDDGDMDLLLTEVLEQVVDLAVFGYEEGGAYEFLLFVGLGV